MISYHPKSSKAPVGTTFTYGYSTMPWSSITKIAHTISTYAWSPCIYKEGHRHTRNFIKAQWLALDFDSGEMTLADACNTFCDMIHVIGTTRSHQKEKNGITCDRFRVLLKWTAPITCAKTYQYNMGKIIKSYDSDPSGSDAARHFFACKEIVSVSDDGYTQDVEELDLSYQDFLKKKDANKRRCGILSSYALRKLSSTWPPFTKNTTCFALGCELARCGSSYEDAVARVLDAPEYAHRKVEQTLYDEIAEAVFNGFRAEGVTSGRYQSYKQSRSKPLNGRDE